MLAVPSARAYYFTNTGAMNIERYDHTSVLLPNGKVFVAAGFNGDVGNVATSETYDPATGSWTTNGDLLEPCSDNTATLLTNGLVLIAGGADFNGSLTNAELYNPTTGVWTETGPLSHARLWHTATLLKNGKVLVTGGYDFTTSSNVTVCELYNQATGTWTDTGALNSGRFRHTATLLTNGLVLVVGGDGATTCELYNPATGTWTLTGPTQVSCQQQTATLLPNGLVLIAGGSGDNTSELYNPATGTWTFTTGAMNAARTIPTATLLPNGQVLVAGGYDANNSATVLASTELYDPASQTWATNFDMTSVRGQQTANLLPNGNVLLAGGFDGTNAIASAELYFAPAPPPSAGFWTTTGSLNTIRALHTLTLLPNGKVLAAAGEGAGYFSVATAELYDPTVGIWKATGSLAVDRYGHTATLLGNGKVLVAGGIQSFSTFGNIASTELYNPTNGTWATNRPMTTSRYGFTATLLGNGKVLAAGGQSHDVSGYNGLASAELYDPNLGTWTLTGTMPNVHQFHTATLLTNGLVLVAGGQDNNGSALTNADLYNPTSGLWTTTGGMIKRHSGHTATLLPNGKVLVAGGVDENYNPQKFSELYDPVTGTWAATGALNVNRSGSTAILLTNGLVLIAGPDNSAELYSPTSGVWTAAATMHNQRQQFPLVQINGQVLVAGGFYFSSLTNAEIYSLNALAALPVYLTSSRLASGAVRFGFTNTPGIGFTALATTNLSLALSNWSVIGSVTEVSSGAFQFTDQQATNGTQRFYRVRSP
jgi:WD40 repeat protein